MLSIFAVPVGQPAALILKHNNPARGVDDEGVSVASAGFRGGSYCRIRRSVVVNRTLDLATAELINSVYFEVVAAPAFDDDALAELKKKKNLRILQIPGITELETLVRQPFLDIKSLSDGGMVLQFSFRNAILEAGDFLPAKTEKDGSEFLARSPSKQEADDLLFAWAVEAGVTSNSVLFVRDGVTTAIGTGEQIEWAVCFLP